MSHCLIKTLGIIVVRERHCNKVLDYLVFKSLLLTSFFLLKFGCHVMGVTIAFLFVLLLDQGYLLRFYMI